MSKPTRRRLHYKRCMDGEKRANVRVTLLLSREELEAAERYARERGEAGLDGFVGHAFLNRLWTCQQDEQTREWAESHLLKKREQTDDLIGE